MSRNNLSSIYKRVKSILIGWTESVLGQNGSGQNGTAKWYTDKMSLDKMVWTKWYE